MLLFCAEAAGSSLCPAKAAQHQLRSVCAVQQEYSLLADFTCVIQEGESKEFHKQDTVGPRIAYGIWQT